MKRAKVLYQYDAGDETQLSVYEGEIVEVTDTSSEEWWKGRIGNRSGWFPSGYVELIKDPISLPKRPIPIPNVTVSSPQIPAKPLPNPTINNLSNSPTQTRGVPLMGSRVPVSRETTSTSDANPQFSSRSNFSSRPMPTLPAAVNNNTNNYSTSIQQPVPPAKPLPTLNRPIPTLATPTHSTAAATYSISTSPSQYNGYKSLPVSPRTQLNSSAEMPPVTPRSQWSDTTRTAVERKPVTIPIPAAVSTPSKTSPPNTNTTSYMNTSQYNSSPATSSLSSGSQNVTTTQNSNPYNPTSTASSSSQSSAATIVQSLNELPPTPNKVPKMESAKSGDVIRLQIVEGRNFNLGEKPVVTVSMQTRGTTRQVFKTGKGKSPTNPLWNEAFRINVSDPENEQLILKAGTHDLIFPLAKAKRNFDFPQHQFAWFKFNNSTLELKSPVTFDPDILHLICRIDHNSIKSMEYTK